jgi:hypothetical protein
MMCIGFKTAKDPEAEKAFACDKNEAYLLSISSEE